MYVQYLTVNLKKVQYRPSVTNCVQYLMVDLKRVQYHQTVIDCVQYPTMNLMKIHYDQSLTADCVQYLIVSFKKKLTSPKSDIIIKLDIKQPPKGAIHET